MRGMFIVAILLSLLVTIFALANNDNTTDLNYLLGTLENVPISLLIIVSLALGVLTMFLFNIPSWFKKRKEKAALKKEIQTLKKENLELKNRLEISNTAPSNDFVNDVEKE